MVVQGRIMGSTAASFIRLENKPRGNGGRRGGGLSIISSSIEVLWGHRGWKGKR